MKTLITESGREGKTRSFEATLLGHITADVLWEGGRTDTKKVRPVWTQLATSEGACRPFVANLKMGRTAYSPGSNYRDSTEEFEFLKTAGYQYLTQRVPGGNTITIFMPDLFRADPGMVDPAGVSFCLLPTTAWLAEQTKHIDMPSVLSHAQKLYEPRHLGIEVYRRWNEPHDPGEEIRLREALLQKLIPLSTLFALYLDRRTHCPIVPDVRFQLQMLVSALSQGLAWLPGSGYSKEWGKASGAGYKTELDERLGFAEGVACKASHESIEGLLSIEIERYFTAIAPKRLRKAS